MQFHNRNEEKLGPGEKGRQDSIVAENNKSLKGTI